MIGRRGMTLVELVVALALVGMMTAIAAVMWTQLARWDEAAAAAQTSLRPQRVVMMLDRQWAARTPAADAEEAEDGPAPVAGRARASRGSLTFQTFRPSLHPAWPTVEATYRVERLESGRLALLYGERRLGPTGEAVGLDPDPETLALLEGATELVWRYRVSRGEEGDAEPPIVEWTEDPAALTLRETRLIAVELWARLSSGEEAAWIGIVEPLR